MNCNLLTNVAIQKNYILCHLSLHHVTMRLCDLCNLCDYATYSTKCLKGSHQPATSVLSDPCPTVATIWPGAITPPLLETMGTGNAIIWGDDDVIIGPDDVIIWPDDVIIREGELVITPLWVEFRRGWRRLELHWDEVRGGLGRFETRGGR